MQKEKEEVTISVTKKEEQATEEMKAAAKKELKAYSETELTGIVSSANDDANKECDRLESQYKSKKSEAVRMLVDKVKNPETLFPTKN